MVTLTLNKKSIDLAIVMSCYMTFVMLSYTFLDTLCNRTSLLAGTGDVSVFSSLISTVKSNLQPSDAALQKLRQTTECVCAVQWVHHNRSLLPLLQSKLRIDVVKSCVRLFVNGNRVIWTLLAEVIVSTRVSIKDIRSILSSLKLDLQSRAAEQLRPYFPNDGFCNLSLLLIDLSDLIRVAISPKLRVQSPHRSLTPSSPRFSTTPRKSSAVFTFEPQSVDSPAVSPHVLKPMDPRDYGRIRQKSEDVRLGSVLSQKNIRETSVELSYSVLSSSAQFAQYVSFLHPSPFLDMILGIPEKGEVHQNVYDILDIRIREGKGLSDGDLRFEVDCVIRFLVLRLLGKRILGEKDSVINLVVLLCESRRVTLTRIEVKMLLLGLFYVNSFSSISNVLLRVIDSCGHDTVFVFFCFYLVPVNPSGSFIVLCKFYVLL